MPVLKFDIRSADNSNWLPRDAAADAVAVRVNSVEQSHDSGRPLTQPD